MSESEEKVGKKPGTRKYVAYLIPVFIIFALSLFTWLQGSNSIDWNWTEDSVTITDPGGETFTVAYSDVIDVSLEQVSDFGECLQGASTRTWIYGIWQNEIWGQYRLCASSDTNICIVLRTEDERFVFSYESAQTTTALYESVLELVNGAG